MTEFQIAIQHVDYHAQPIDDSAAAIAREAHKQKEEANKKYWKDAVNKIVNAPPVTLAQLAIERMC